MKIAFVYMNNAANTGRGAGYILASIPSEHEVKFYDQTSGRVKALSSSIADGNFDLLMISSMTLLWPSAVALIKNIKASCDITVLVGGIHPTIMNVAILEEHPYIDYVCMGEGEQFIKDFLLNYNSDSLFDIKNLIYRKDGKVYSNPLGPPTDLSELPKFPWDAFTRKVTGRYIYVTAARGCPFNCTYCCNGIYLKLYKKNYLRNRPVGQVIDELKILENKYKFQLFYFGDDMMFTDLDYITELFTAIKKNLKRPYGCMGRAEYVNEELVDLMQRTGCVYTGLGVECGDEEFRRKHLKRYMTNEQLINAFKLLRNAKIQTTSFNVIGWPFDNDEDLCKSTVKINKEISPNICQVTWFYPFPGTEMHDYCVDNNLMGTKNIGTYHRGSVLKMHERKPANTKKYLSKFGGVK